jgi:TIR domain
VARDHKDEKKSDQRKMAHDVFICHSAKDKPTADAVCAMLEANGVRCWIAPRDVTAGMEWSECIIDAIEECRVMVLVFTTNANESGQIRREIERAVNRGVAILPLRIEDILPARALEYFIGNVHWLDALTPPLETHLQNLAGTVKILLGRLPHHSSPTPHGTPQPAAIFPQPASIPQSASIPQAPPAPIPIAPPPVQHVAPEKTVWTERARTPEPQEIPMEGAPEIPARTAPRQTEVPPASPPATPVARQKKRATGLVSIPILVFLFSALIVIGTLHDLIYGRVENEEILGLLLGAAGIVASYGVITKKGWGRILLLAIVGAYIVWMLTLTHDAFRESNATIAWIIAFGFCVFLIWYMSTAQVRQEFAEAAVARQNHFASMSMVGAQPSIISGISVRGAGPRPAGVLIVAILSFVEAGIWVLPIWDDFSHGRAKSEDFGAFLLVCAAAATGFGLVRLMGWARFLKVLVAAVDAVLMISVAQNAFHEGGGGEVAWICMFIFIVWSAWFMFTPRVIRAFSKAA